MAGLTSRPVGLLMNVEWVRATFEFKNEVGDLRKFMRPLGPSALGGGQTGLLSYTRQVRPAPEARTPFLS